MAPSKVPQLVGDLESNLVHGSLDPRDTIPKQHLDLVSCFLHSSSMCQTYRHNKLAPNGPDSRLLATDVSAMFKVT